MISSDEVRMLKSSKKSQAIPFPSALVVDRGCLVKADVIVIMNHGRIEGRESERAECPCCEITEPKSHSRCRVP